MCESLCALYAATPLGSSGAQRPGQSGHRCLSTTPGGSAAKRTVHVRASKRAAPALKAAS